MNGRKRRFEFATDGRIFFFSEKGQKNIQIGVEEALSRLQQLYLQQAMNAHSTRVKEPLGITLPAIKPRIRTHTFAQILPGPKQLYDILHLKLHIPLFCFSLINSGE